VLISFEQIRLWTANKVDFIPSYFQHIGKCQAMHDVACTDLIRGIDPDCDFHSEY